MRRSIFHSKNIYRSVIIRVNLNVLRSQHIKSRQFSPAAVLCASETTHKLSERQQPIYLYLLDTPNTFRRVLSGVFIATKTQETFSRRNTGSGDMAGLVPHVFVHEHESQCIKNANSLVIFSVKSVNILLFHKIHCRAVSFEKDKYMTPAHSLKTTRSSHSGQYIADTLKPDIQ